MCKFICNIHRHTRKSTDLEVHAVVHLRPQIQFYSILSNYMHTGKRIHLPNINT